ncbi:glucosamine inositolphosphorylceramide transferase family protein [Saccharibacter floricola]|uniref:Glucosamine inositolphosphorylceramide transferase 1 N-terminal domain-containing protein n=1 Tax=Saccharibacter floricola DSM 15669 TaxID=1123227 RepID=A0ABQ0NX39_9PROT|nr:hypothetical protein [Saccharibacter floricola]GBQ04887.1 hypothetical protein AA15669_0199 [Saccharibacter floricola DSM 15669]
MSLFEMDHWRCAIVHAPFEEVIKRNTLEGYGITWLPDHGKRHFFADPFGIWHDGRLYVFVESYDYHSGKGKIDVLVYDEAFSLIEHETVLQEPWHLSYPQIIRHGDEFYLLPEGYKSGRLSLYRAVKFPYQWERVTAFDFPIGAIDATPLFYRNRWWLFWTPPTPKSYRQSALHIALAEELTGSWCDMGCVLVDREGARPGGTACVVNDDVILPVQDCSLSYGGGMQTLRISGLGYGKPRIETRGHFPLPKTLAGSHSDGMHTLSAAGSVTLVDFKKINYGIAHKIPLIRDLVSKR